jgi:hypothetical protein
MNMAQNLCACFYRFSEIETNKKELISITGRL